MKYWAIIDKERKGPLSFEEIIALGITPDTYVWRKGLKDWTKAENVEELMPVFAAQPEAVAEEEEENSSEQESMIEILDDEPEGASANEQSVEQQESQPQETQAQTEIPAPAAPVPPDPTFTQPAPQPAEENMPHSWLWLSVLTSCCCCMPLGLLACWFSARIEDLYAAGRYEEANKSAKSALWCNIITIILTITAVLLFI